MKKFLISLTLALAFSNIAFGYDYYSSGKTEFQKGNYLKANSLFKIELQKNPGNIDCRYLYAQSFVGLEDTENAQVEYEKVIEQAPGSRLAKFATVAISMLYENQTENVAKKTKSTKSSGLSFDNYIDNALYNGQIVRWSLSGMPLKIYINQPAGVPGYQSYYYSVTVAAIESWVKEAEAGILSYVLVNDRKKADISFDFVSNIGKQSETGYLLGLAKPYIKGNILENCTIELRTRDINNNPIPKQEMFITALHEFGHTLGIWGHSSRVSDVMYDCESENSENSAQGLSLRDINTLRILYMLDPEISNFAPGEGPGENSQKNKFVLGSSGNRINNKFQENIDYVKKHPKNALSWSNLGNTYDQTGNHKDAITCYNKALELDPAFTDARNALAISYDKVGDKENALKQFATLVSQEPKNISFSYNLALYLVKSSRKQDAKSVLNKLIINNPDAKSDKNINKLLNDVN